MNGLGRATSNDRAEEEREMDKVDDGGRLTLFSLINAEHIRMKVNPLNSTNDLIRCVATQLDSVDHEMNENAYTQQQVNERSKLLLPFRCINPEWK